MAFFNNQKNAGLALLLFAVLSILAAIITAVCAICKIDSYDYADAIPAIGALIGGILYLGFAQRVRGKASNGKIDSKLGTSGGALSDKFDIVVEFVHVFAIATIVEGIFYIIGGAVAGSTSGISSGVIDIIFGIICVWLYKKITDGKESLVDKIVWILLVIVFILTIIGGLVMLVGIITIPLGIASIIIGIFMLMAVLDNDVKAKFGM